MTTPVTVNDPTTNGVDPSKLIDLPAEFAEYSIVSYSQVGKTFSDRLSNYVGQTIGVYGVPSPEANGERKVKNSDEKVAAFIYRLNVLHAGESKVVKVPETVAKRMSKILSAQKSKGIAKPIVVVKVVQEDNTIILQDPINPRKRTKRGSRTTSATPTVNASPSTSGNASTPAPTTPSGGTSRSTRRVPVAANRTRR